MENDSIYLSYGTLHSDSTSYKDYASGLPNKSLVSSFSSFSILGSTLIIASYVKWTDIRTTSRRLLVFISICDFMVSSGYLVVDLMPMHHRENGNAACIAQSFITSSASTMSFMWSTSLAIYLYFTLVINRQRMADKLIPVFHIVSWMTGPIINVIAATQNALGSSSDKVTAGWCWIAHHNDPESRTHEILWMLFDGKFWEILAMLLISVLYILVKRRIKMEVSNVFGLMINA